MKEKGFTLIELLVVIAIIGILAAIAIPQFAQYRQRAFDSAAVTDLRNLMTTQEAYYTTNLAYAAAVADLNAFGFVASLQGGTATCPVVNAGDGTSWDGTSSHPSGTLTYAYDSAANAGITQAAGSNC